MTVTTHPNHIEPSALSIKEAMVISGLGRNMLYDAMREMRLRSLKIGKRRLILRKDLEDFLEAEAERYEAEQKAASQN